MSLRGLFTPLGRIGLDTEYAIGNSETGDGGSQDDAYRIKLDGHEKWVSYQLEMVHAGPDCPGYYRDLDFKSAQVSIPVWDSLRLNAQWRDHQQNPDLNPAFRTALHSRHSQLGFSYRLGPRTNVSLDYRNRLLEDLLPHPEFDSREETLGLAVGQQFKNFSLWVSAEGGEELDSTADRDDARGPIQRYSLSALLNPASNQSYKAFLQFDEGGLCAGGDSRLTGGVGASFSLGKTTSLSVNFLRNQYAGAISRSRDQFDLLLGHRFRNEHELLVRGRYAFHDNSVEKDETCVIVEYGIPFSVPVSRKTKTAMLQGRVYDAENGQRAIPGVVVRLNQLTTVTDRRGNFIFGSLKPGKYYLTLDKAGIGMNRLTVQSSPLGVVVAGGKRNWVEVGVTRRARVKGRVAVYPATREQNATPGWNREAERVAGEKAQANAPPGEPVFTANGLHESADSYGLPNVLVELSNSSEVLRRFTDRKGRFLFEDVRPGDWTLKVVNAELPEHHYLEKESFSLDLKPADEKEFLARVLPRERPIQIIETGEVIGQTP